MSRIKEIAVTGGKGGTGKSTATILLAKKFFQAGKKVLVVDADVECPNDYLLLNQSLSTVVEKAYAQFPTLDKEKCRQCGLCAEACPNNAIFQAPGEYPVFNYDLCDGCGTCWNVCPYGAIIPKKKEIGKIYKNDIKEGFSLITGAAKPILEETSPVVQKAREVARAYAQEKGFDLILIDTAPGTHCSVIRALMNTDLVYAVTEPTPMGAYDLDLILDLVKKLDLKAEVVLNKAGVGKREKIEKVVRDYKLKITEEIPYSKKLAELYSRNKLSEFKY